MRLSKRGLLMGHVSIVALSVCGSAVLASDLPAKAPIVTKAPPAGPGAPVWSWWAEGGLQAISGGDPGFISGFTPGFAPQMPNLGWSGAGGVDYRINAMWHVSGDFRYGASQTRTTSNQNGLAKYRIFGLATTTTPAVGSNSATRTESNWVADFMVGRDIGLGAGSSQLKAGLRIANIRGTTDGAGRMITAPTATGVVNLSYKQTSNFIGLGPRIALEGNAPLSGPWSLDYMVGAAALFGDRKIDQTTSVIGTTTSPNFVFLGCTSGCPGAFSNSSSGAVFNAGAMLGIAYAITPNAKLGLNYRVDYYADAMRTVDSAGIFSNTNRTYQGPSVRLSVQY